MENVTYASVELGLVSEYKWWAVDEQTPISSTLDVEAYPRLNQSVSEVWEGATRTIGHHRGGSTWELEILWKSNPIPASNDR